LRILLHPFRPRLLSSLQSYHRRRLAADIGAGLTVGIVALPLAIAFAIASGLKPEAGLFTAIIAGFLISSLGGSSVQIGGPAGAFIVIVYGIVERYGLANLLISTALAGTRTVTNLRAGATSPVAGMVHALTLLLVVLVAAPLALHVPLAALAGILLFVAWNMGEWREFAHARRFNLPYRTVLLGTFILTIVFDLTVAVEVGLVQACVFFIWRMGRLFRVEARSAEGLPVRLAPQTQVFDLHGALFFGAVAEVEDLPQRLQAGTQHVVLDMHRLFSIDTSGLEALKQLHRSLQRQGVTLTLVDVNEQPLSLIRRSGFAAALGAARILADWSALAEVQTSAERAAARQLATGPDA
jgi:anti-anti-sigma factor